MNTEFHTNGRIVPSANLAWHQLISDIMRYGRKVAPRNQQTLELPQHTIALSMRRPVITVVERKLNYRFMAAEAYWIMTGDNRVSTIAPYNSKIADFSDDGKTFFGAYGPRWVHQLDHVVQRLIEDPMSRQAGVTFWRENPPRTKDVPCTIALFFEIREARVHCHAFMRSSDAWLGVPYDVFNFSMLAHQVCALIAASSNRRYTPGALFLTAASSHLYEQHWEAVNNIITAGFPAPVPDSLTPDEFSHDSSALEAALDYIRSGDKTRRWWVSHE